jgi:hypothetical protein
MEPQCRSGPAAPWPSFLPGLFSGIFFARVKRAGAFLWFMVIATAAMAIALVTSVWGAAADALEDR